MELTKKAKPGDIVHFGSYPSSLILDDILIEKIKLLPFNQYGVGMYKGTKYLKEDNKYYKFESLEWIVVSKKPGGIFKLISKNIVDRCSLKYKTSNGRSCDYFNYKEVIFANRAFNQKERSMLQISDDLENSKVYTTVNYPSLVLAKKFADLSMDYSDYVKRYFNGQKPDSYYLYRNSYIHPSIGYGHEAFYVEKKKEFFETNYYFPLGLRPVIIVKVEN